MERIVIYHNPSCGQSRSAHRILSDRKIEFDTIEYLKHPPDRATLARILAMLEAPPADLVRKDKRFAALGLKAEDYMARDSVIDLLLKYPELMQRPIVIRGERAMIARPGEKVTELL
ncbi:MAG TPA: ArsC/Spx/MgsR family protein [Candidatus Binataceae bacterium]|nr:ArsC/Spx/MgsR family protein [Candidatus Binataceae bacterium]